MAYINVDVDIDIEDYIDEISAEDLIAELQSRKQEASVYKSIDVYKIFGAESLQDVIKVEAFLKKYKDVPES
ncbi:MAG TPA: hypothetical protein VK023_05215, partial [Sphingobacterium bovisgrunnientis]|nr:hypothetical protein [Sphingobacterium bovisgrunnientis]